MYAPVYVGRLFLVLHLNIALREWCCEKTDRNYLANNCGRASFPE